MAEVIQNPIDSLRQNLTNAIEALGKTRIDGLNGGLFRLVYMYQIDVKQEDLALVYNNALHYFVESARLIDQHQPYQKFSVEVEIKVDEKKREASIVHYLRTDTGPMIQHGN